MTDKKNNKPKKKTSIGGQAVMEGVMMRGASSVATAVRDADGVIRLEAERVTPLSKKNIFFRLPVIRGAVNFFISLVSGTKVLMRSAEVYGEDEGEPSKFEKWISQKLKIDVMNLVMFFSVVLGLALSIFLFVALPHMVGQFILDYWKTMPELVRNLIEGFIRILIFVLYIVLTSLLKDIRRTYMYHGAEHKTINCYEKGLDLTVENVKSCTRVHNRCGTTFMFFVMVVSILVYSVFGALFHINDFWIKLVVKILLLPLVAGLSYELLKGLAKTENPIFYPLKAPGLLLQRLTTREPDDGMMEVAIASFNKVLSMDNNPEEKGCKFVCSEKIDSVLTRVKEKLKQNGISEEAEAEWIVSICSGVNRDKLKGNIKIITPKNVEKIDKIVSERITAKPLWYIIGNTDFYGITVNVNESVLIPRPETEELVAAALREIKAGDKVLDMCTGSGAIAIAVRLNSDTEVTASDIAAEALKTAKQNADLSKAEINFIESDMFVNITDKFNVIITNPPYIKTGDIPTLQKEVKDFEPLSALDGGEDGLKFYRIIAEKATEHLIEGGKLFAEVGEGEAEEVALLFKNKFASVEIIKDINGIERIVKAVF